MTTAGILAQQATLHSGELHPGLLPSTNAFFQHFLVFDAKIVQSLLMVNPSTIYPPSLSYARNLNPSLFTSGAIYPPSLRYNQFLTMTSRIVSTNVIYAPHAIKNPLRPGLLTNAQSFRTPIVVRASKNLLPGLLPSTLAFYAPNVVHKEFLRLPLLSEGQTFYGPTLVAAAPGVQTLVPGLLASSNSFYAPTVNLLFVTTVRVNAQPNISQPVQVTRTSATTLEP